MYEIRNNFQLTCIFLARSAKSRSDVAPNARAAQADANLDQGFYT